MPWWSIQIPILVTPIHSVVGPLRVPNLGLERRWWRVKLGKMVCLIDAISSCMCEVSSLKVAIVPYASILSLLSNIFKTQRMIQRQSMLQCAVPTHNVFGTVVNVHTTHNYMHKMWIFTILKPHKSVRRIQIHLDRRVLMLWSLVPSSLKWTRLSKLPSYFSFKTPTVFNGCCSLLQRLKFKYQ